MNNSRRFESISGSLAALFGLVVLAYVLFGPMYQGINSSGQSGTTSLLQVGIQPVTMIAFSLLLLALVGVAISAILHSRTEGNGWRVLLGISVVVIIAFTLLTLPSIGLFIVPSTLLALLAFVLSFIARRAVAG
ncbi:MAG TPA: hypothetical protein VFV38_12280 [Ktedonobacteraceae bacterium]|nr:hypothetical protein [Ktedonobacteraceae bacterium]